MPKQVVADSWDWDWDQDLMSMNELSSTLQGTDKALDMT